MRIRNKRLRLARELAPNEAALVVRYAQSVSEGLALGERGVVLSNVLVAGAAKLVLALQDSHILPAKDGKRLRRALEDLRARHPDLPADWSAPVFADDPRCAIVCGRLRQFLTHEMSPKGQQLFPTLMALLLGAGEFDESVEEHDSLQPAFELLLEQLGGEEVLIKADGISVLHRELVEPLLRLDLPFVPLTDWLVTNHRYDVRDATELLGGWLGDAVPSLDLDRGRSELRRAALARMNERS